MRDSQIPPAVGGRDADPLRITEERYRELVLASSQIVWSYSAAGGMGSFKQVEEWWENLTGQPSAGPGGSPTRWLEMVHPDDRDATAAAWGTAIAAGDGYDIEYRARGRDGGWRTLFARGVPIPGPDGVVREGVGTLTDVTLQRSAEADRERLLREVEAERRHLAELFQHAPSFMCVLRGPDHVFVRANDRYAELLGGRPLVGRAVREAVPEVEGQGYFEALDRVYRTGEPYVAAGARVRLARGGRLEERVLDFVYQPLRDADGRVSGVLVHGVDLTAHHRAEERLRQAAKMEVVGHLAGGVAHDFNNLLTVINGYSAMMVEEGGDERAADILAAGRRAAELTQQLLAFSRRQVLKPTPFDLNELVRNLGKMLGRLIGEDVRVATDLRPSVGRVVADPGQVEQVLVNLCANARDAMPRGGCLRIETADVPAGAAPAWPGARPGGYARLSVEDTGCGMPDDVRERIFEPFFTTKGVGAGTGLGLSTVLGIVGQSGGHVEVSSQVGRGTRFDVYLPAAAAPPTQPAPISASLPNGRETILLVEDEQAVRRLTAAVLRKAGYAVVEAGGAEEAVHAHATAAVPFDLLLTDVVMAGPSGRELAERLAAVDPDLGVVYMSGYPDDAVLRNGISSSDVEFLHKPFARETLLHKIRNVLDRPRPAADSLEVRGPNGPPRENRTSRPLTMRPMLPFEPRPEPRGAGPAE